MGSEKCLGLHLAFHAPSYSMVLQLGPCHASASCQYNTPIVIPVTSPPSSNFSLLSIPARVAAAAKEPESPWTAEALTVGSLFLVSPVSSWPLSLLRFGCLMLLLGRRRRHRPMAVSRHLPCWICAHSDIMFCRNGNLRAWRRTD